MVVNDDTVITVDTRSFGQFRVGYNANADNDDVCRKALVAADYFLDLAIPGEASNASAGVNVDASTFVQLVVVGGHFWRGHALQNALLHFQHMHIETKLSPDCCHL